MRFKNYLQDKVSLIIFYFFVIGFISLVVKLDPNVKVGTDNMLYMNFVSIILFIVYLICEYLQHRRYYKNLKFIIDEEKSYIIHSLPEPKTYEQRLYIELLKKIHEVQNEKIDRLCEGKRENQEFITSWVHEIKTPIAVSRLIIENSATKAMDEVLNSIEEEIDKIDDFVEQSLYYSRIDSFSKDYLINEMELGKVVRNSIKKHAKTFIDKKIKVEIDTKNLTVTSDAKWLNFIIDQIINNSLKYTGNGGKITVNAEKDEKEKRLIIEDNGIGIKSEDIGRVFNKGFTGVNGRRQYKSTGMGLYLAKSLANKLGHDITIESFYGEYTRVTIHFPKLMDYYKVID